MRRVLLTIAGLCLGAIGTGCMHAPRNAQRDPDRSPPTNPRQADPPRFIMRGDQIYELLVAPRGSAHVELPPGTIEVKGHNYVPRAAVFQQGTAAPVQNATPSNELPYPNKMPEKAKTSTPATSFGKQEPRKSATELPDDDIPRGTVIGVRPMTPEEVVAWEREKEAAAKKAVAPKTPSAVLGPPYVEEERSKTPADPPKDIGPILMPPVESALPATPTVPTPTITPPPSALPRLDRDPPPPAQELPPEDPRPKVERKDLQTSNRK